MRFDHALLALIAMTGVAAAACSSTQEEETTEDELFGSGYSEDSLEQNARSMEEEYKYGSDGADTDNGIPYLVFRAMPRAFPELLPRDRASDSWSAFGFIEEPGRDRPIGFSLRRYQLVNRVGPNCAACHTGTYRESETGERKIVLGGANQRVDIQGFLRFVARAADHPQFYDRLMTTMDRIAEEQHEKTWIAKRLLVKTVLLPLTRKGFKKNISVDWMTSRPDWGPGRIDPFNPVKFGMLKLERDETLGNSDAMPIWSPDRPMGRYHWDGLQTSLREVFISSALGDGATLESVEIEKLDRKREWLQTVQPPAFPRAIDQTKAAAGKGLFTQHCGECHSRGGTWLWNVIPIERVGTDRNRLDMWTAVAANTYNRFSEGQPWEMRNFEKTRGYLATDLRGVWLTGPYLHNGSVPSLRALLEPPAARPPKFMRAYDVVDFENVGFVSDGRTNGQGFAVDTSVRGNSNQGHTFGTDLPPADKDALVEYMKTL